ncbi:MAG: XdhC/CoxI family protein [Acidobacteria bacterium]|nr:XdhC/CoxI family protein [Acidobacteriota bacterium]
MSDGESVVTPAASWLAEGRRVATATVVNTWRSAPRPVGSQMAVNDSGQFVGSVSGGCVESTVIQACQDLLRKGEPRSLEFGVSNERAWEVGLACGGQIEVWVAEAEPAVLARLARVRGERSPVAVLIDLSTGAQRVVEPEDASELPSELRSGLEQALRDDQSRAVEDGGRRWFLHVFNPPARIVIVGAVHLAQILAPLASLSGFEVIVVDPRTSFARADRFPGVALDLRWPGAAFTDIGLDRRTAVAALSHDPKLDDPALASALDSDCFYVGALGGRKSREGRRVRLGELGIDDDQLERIHGPIGLDIGARTPAEIALAILAQIIDRLRKPVAS